jgi:hypothetical protein
LETDPDVRAISFSVIDISGDTWPGKLYVALTATYAAVQAWLELYQACTNTSIFDVRDELSWAGDADPDNATAAFRAGKENGINLLFKNADTLDTFPIRVVGPVAAIMQGNQDIPLAVGAGSLDELIVATIGLQPDYNFVSMQYTTHRERSGNPKVK